MDIRGPQLASLESSPPTPALGGAPPAAARLPDSGGPIVFFDGVCGLCNRFVDFVIKRDRAGVFRFAPLQGETARERLPAADVRDGNTMGLGDEEGGFRKSTGGPRLLLRLGGFWGLIGATLRLVPPPLRNAGYSLVARYRYRIFGKK